MLASISASTPFLKGSALLGFKMAYFHASSICCEKRADKFRSGYKGYSHKDYLNYAKRKRRAAEKRECLSWRSCEIHICNFEQLYWSCGNLRKFQRQWGPGRCNSHKDYNDSDAQFGCKSKKRSSQRSSRKGPFETMWQAFHTEWWEDIFHEDFAYGTHGSPFTTDRSNASSYSWDTTDENPGKKKAEAESPTIGLSSDRLTLGLAPTGSLTIEELKRAFRASALKWHPDRHEDAAKGRAEAKFKDCGAAYKSLLNALAKS